MLQGGGLVETAGHLGVPECPCSNGSLALRRNVPRISQVEARDKNSLSN